MFQLAFFLKKIGGGWDRKEPYFVGAFSFKGKMPDSYNDFFLQTTDITLIGPLVKETTKTTQAKSG